MGNPAGSIKDYCILHAGTRMSALGGCQCVEAESDSHRSRRDRSRAEVVEAKLVWNQRNCDAVDVNADVDAVKVDRRRR